jgi:hypothetical protein
VREARAWLALIRHTITLARSGQLRFRLETFGVYYPELPYRAPLWRVSLPVTALLLRRSRAYAHWLLEMHELRAGRSWWDRPR